MAVFYGYVDLHSRNGVDLIALRRARRVIGAHDTGDEGMADHVGVGENDPPDALDILQDFLGVVQT